MCLRPARTCAPLITVLSTLSQVAGPVKIEPVVRQNSRPGPVRARALEVMKDDIKDFDVSRRPVRRAPVFVKSARPFPASSEGQSFSRAGLLKLAVLAYGCVLLSRPSGRCTANFFRRRTVPHFCLRFIIRAAHCVDVNAALPDPLRGFPSLCCYFCRGGLGVRCASKVC